MHFLLEACILSLKSLFFVNIYFAAFQAMYWHIFAGKGLVGKKGLVGSFADAAVSAKVYL